MNLYLISQNINDQYETYDSAVVAAENECDAIKIHPSGNDDNWGNYRNNAWCDQSNVKVELIGKADNNIKRGVICASFNTI